MPGEILFFRRSGDPAPPGAADPFAGTGFSPSFWQPRPGAPIPPGVRDPRLIAYGLMAALGLLDRRHYGVLVVRDPAGRIAHRAFLMPRFGRFPFMAPGDLQIGAVETYPGFRGRGLAARGLAWLTGRFAAPGRTFWYLTEAENAASVATARKAGFALAGSGAKHARLGLQFLGYYDMRPPAPGAGRSTDAGADASEIS